MTGNDDLAGRSDRFDAPLYLARYRQRQQQPSDPREPSSNGDAEGNDGNGTGPADSITADTTADSAPLYLKRFRDRDGASPAPAVSDDPLWRRADLSTQQALTEDNRNKEIAAPPGATRRLVNDVYLIRHGETQGYSTDSGLTPQGAWQAHTYGRTLSRRVKDGETIVFRHADTNRARETAEQIHRGFSDGLTQYEKSVNVVEPAAMDEFRNFQFVAPDGLKDVTAAFRQYHSLLEGFERAASSDRPLWLVEMDRFWRTQQGGGDPIQHWLTIPMLHFEPPSMTVRRFWAGINSLSAEFPGARLAISTHSGCIRAFAVAALGYDPGEPYNTEHVRVKLLADADDRDGGNPDGGNPNGRDAMVTYRNRVQEVKVPVIDQLPVWTVDDRWPGFTESRVTGP
ncbi:MAG: histidine phosphatase family protein [Acidimicrobiales bacterium]